MFASVAVADFIYERLGSIGPLVSLLPTSQMTGAMVVPQGTPLPAILFYLTYSEYGGPVTTYASAHTASERLRVEVKVIGEGTSDSAIYPIAKQVFDALAGVVVDHGFDSATWSLSFTTIGEIPLTTLVDGSTIYRQLGATFYVDVFRA